MAERRASACLVLVVNDDPLLRASTVDRLRHAGYEVLEAEDADAALRVLEVHGHRVEGLFTPIHLPGSMEGRELTQRVLERWPHIRSFLRDEDDPHGSPFIDKADGG